MPWFFKQQKDSPRRPLSEDQKIALIEAAYLNFQKKLTVLEKERDAKIADIVKTIDGRKIHDILRRVEATQ